MSDSEIINFFFEDIEEYPFSEEIFRKWISFIVSSEGYECGSVNVIFCSDAYLITLNKQYLDHDTFTDIITFDYTNDNSISGDIYISIDRIYENAKEYKISFEEELVRVISHGILHLVGYNDKNSNEKFVMTEREDFYIRSFKSSFLNG